MSENIIIKIDLINNTTLSFDGLGFLFNLNPRIILRMKTAISLDFSDGRVGYIKCSEESLFSVIEQVESFFKRHEIKYEFSSGIHEVASKHFLDKESFVKFSEQAREKRDSKFKPEELDIFDTSVHNLISKNRKLKRHQLLSAYHICFAKNACNFSVPGAGKTSVILTCFAYLNALLPDDPRHVDKLMVMGPLSSFKSWEDEYRFCFEENPLDVVVRINGSVDMRTILRQLMSRTPKKVTLISFGSIKSNSKEIESFLSNNKTMLVVDEAHKIKNLEGVTALTILEISKEAKSRIILTGTPAPNGYEDLYNIFEFIWPGKNVIGFTAKQLQDMTQRRRKGESDERVEMLYKNTAPFFNRVTKKHLDLPDYKIHPHSIVLTEEERAIYEKLKSLYTPQIEAAARGERVRSNNGLVRVIRLMQAATNPSLLTKEISSSDFNSDIEDSPIEDFELLEMVKSFEKNNVPSKFKVALEIIKKEIRSGGRVVVWSTFVKNIEKFMEYLKKNDIEAKAIHGSIPVGDDDTPEEIDTRERIINEFLDESKSMNVLIANPQAAAESISLHSTCHRAIYLDRSFNAAHFMQSKDRIHRVGLKPGTITNYDILLSNDTIDEAVNQRLNDKEKAMMEIVENEPIPLLDLNMTGSFGDMDDLVAVVKNLK